MSNLHYFANKISRLELNKQIKQRFRKFKYSKIRRFEDLRIRRFKDSKIRRFEDLREKISLHTEKSCLNFSWQNQNSKKISVGKTKNRGKIKMKKIQGAKAKKFIDFFLVFPHFPSLFIIIRTLGLSGLGLDFFQVFDFFLRLDPKSFRPKVFWRCSTFFSKFSFPNFFSTFCCRNFLQNFL